MHRLALTLAALAVAAVVAPVAWADPPAREPAPAPATFTITDSCTFDVRVDVLVNKEFATTFASGRQIITGRLVVRVTNLDNQAKTLVLQSSGPAIEDLADPSKFNLSGTSFWFFPGALLLTRGPASITLDASGNVTSFSHTSASIVDLCAALA
jgi:hypothetical protein